MTLRTLIAHYKPIYNKGFFQNARPLTCVQIVDQRGRYMISMLPHYMLIDDSGEYTIQPMITRQF